VSLLITRQNISKFFFPCMPEIRLSIRNKNPAYCLPKLETTFWVGPFWPGNDQKIAGKQCLEGLRPGRPGLNGVRGKESLQSLPRSHQKQAENDHRQEYNLE